MKGTTTTRQFNVTTRRQRAAAAKTKGTEGGSLSDGKSPPTQSSPLNVHRTSPQKNVNIDEITHKSTKSPPQMNKSLILSDDETLYDLYGTTD